jgi:pimeloyl-ACP methyl ester carboxylesterase
MKKSISRFLVVIVVIVSFSFTASPQLSSSKRYKTFGRMVDIGGRRLHINCQGSGDPTVVIENGTGDFSFDWILVQPEVSRFTRVCTYDRAGYAWSDAGPMPRTFEQIALELHTGLQTMGVKAPYLMVGQSYGGFLARAFAKYYKSEVAGVVLVDSMHEDSSVMINGKVTPIRETARGLKIPPAQLKIDKRNAPKLNGESSQPKTSVDPPLDRLPADVQRLRLWAESLGAYDEFRTNELEWSAEELARMYANRENPENKLGNIPLIVLSRGLGYDDPQRETDRKRLQDDLERLSTNSKHIIVEGSGHNIQIEKPQAVIDGIHKVVDAVRNQSRLISQ